MPNWSYISELDAFEIYHQVQEDLNEADDDDLSLAVALRGAALGAAATALSNLATYPLDLICTRLQVQSKRAAAAAGGGGGSAGDYDGVGDAVAKIFNDEGGLGAFYSGVGGDTFKSVVDSFIFFFSYNVLWRSRKSFRPAAVGAAVEAFDGISVGLLAGALTKAITTPIANVVTRQQVQRPGEERRSAADIARDIYDRRGLAGFWTGYSESLVLTLNPALTFFFDAAARRAFRLEGGDDDEGSALATFLVAASGKAAANALTYPFKLAKARAQGASPSQAAAGAKGSSARARAVPRSPVAAVAHIAEAEGVASLYAGVGAELLKGFFSHGLTMLIKEQLPMFGLNLLMAVMRLRAKYRRRNKAA